MSNDKLIPELRFPEFENNGLWQEKVFEELFEIGNGRDYKHLREGDIPVYGSGGYMLSVDEFLYEGESVCIGRKGTIDNPVFLTGKFWTVDTLFYTYEFKGCLPKFIYYIFLNINWLNHNEAGGVPSLSKKNIYKIETAIPPWIEEQQKIASSLSSLDELIAAHNDKLDALKDHKKGLLQNLFPQEGETVPKVRFPEFEGDGEWVEKSIGSIAKVSAGGTPTSTEQKYWGGNIPWMSSGELNLKRVYSVEKTITELGLKESSTKKIPPFCVLIGLAGQGKTRGTAAINYIELCTNQSIAAIHPNRKKFDSEFLYHKIDSMYKTLRRLSTGQGGRGGLNLSIIRRIGITFPSLKEQQKIASCLSAVDELITAQQEKIEELQQHKKGLMQGLFPKSITN